MASAKKTLTLRRELCYLNGYEIPENLQELIEWLQDKLKEVPPGYRETAYFEIDTERSYYESVSIKVHIYYYSPETEEEKQQRLTAEKARSAKVQKSELRLLETLAKKYGAKKL